MSLGVRALAAAHRSGERAIGETVDALLAALDAADPAAWITRAGPDALHARAAALARGPRELPLLGVPFAVKDNIDVAGLPTTAACPDFAYEPARSATVVRALEAAGAIVAGKANLDQFATGLVGTRTPYGACSSTFSAAHVSGGSSSGSAVAVAAGTVPFALGTDTAGSGRIPAAFNELVGLKPTRGLVSTSGMVPACRSLDCVSVFARDAGDSAAVLAACGGYDPGDPFARRAPTAAGRGAHDPFARRAPATDGPVRRPAVLAVPAEPAAFGDAACEAAWDTARAALAELAERVVEVDLAPFAEAAALLYDGPWLAERYAAVGAFLERDDVAADPVVRAIILRGREPSAADLFRAQHRLAELRRLSEGVFAAVDALVVPTAPLFPTHAEVAAEPVAVNARLGTYTNFVNLLDLAALAVPAGRRTDGLPFGVTFVGPAFSDGALLALAGAWAAFRPGR